MIVLLSVTPNTKAGTKEARWKTLKSTHTQPRGAFFGSWFELCHPNSAWLGRHKQLSQIPWQLSSMQQPQFLTMGANQRGTFFSPLPTNLDKSCPSQFLGQRICTQQLIKLAKPSGAPTKSKILHFKLWSFNRIRKSHLEIHNCSCRKLKPCRHHVETLTRPWQVIETRLKFQMSLNHVAILCTALRIQHTDTDNHDADARPMET